MSISRNQKDYQVLANEIGQYVGLFQEAEITQGRK